MPSGQRDAYGFEVKKEFAELYRRYAPLWEKEESERSQRWSVLLNSIFGEEDVHEDISGKTDEQNLQALVVALIQWRAGDSQDAANFPPWYQPVRSLVQAGIPMSIRGQLWKGFLNIQTKRLPGVYEKLVSKALGKRFSGKKQARDVQQVSQPAESGAAQTQQSRTEMPLQAEGSIREHADCSSAATAKQVAQSPFSLDIAKFVQIALEDKARSSADGAAAKAGSAQLSGKAEKRHAAWQHTNTDWNMQIEKDLHRTFPGHPVMDSSGRNALRRMLAAYARRNPSVGYCQGMNFVAGCLLLFMDEEDAFWSLACIIEDLLPGYFSTAMVEPQVDQLVFRHLVDSGFPRLSSHLDSLGAHVAGVSTQWFLCLFVNSLPLETCLRVWDIFFFERCSSVLFRVAMALVDIYAQALVATVDSVDAFSLLQNMAPMSYDSSRLVDVACIAYAHIDSSRIRGLRQQFFSDVEKQFRDRFGKPPEAVRSKSDDNEGLSFTWLPAALRGGQSLVEEDEQGGKAYFPLMGSLQPEAEVPSSDQLVCAEVVPVEEASPEPLAARSAEASSCSTPRSESEAGSASPLSATSTCSWHGTPTWRDITTFSQHTLRHLSRMSNAAPAAVDAGVSVAALNATPEEEEEEGPQEAPLQGEQYEAVAAASSDLAARLPRLNLATLRSRQPEPAGEKVGASESGPREPPAQSQHADAASDAAPNLEASQQQDKSRAAAALFEIAVNPSVPVAEDGAAAEGHTAQNSGAEDQVSAQQEQHSGAASAFVPTSTSDDQNQEQAKAEIADSSSGPEVPPLKDQAGEDVLHVHVTPSDSQPGTMTRPDAKAAAGQSAAAQQMLNLVDLLEEELFAAEARRYDAEVAADALVATEIDLRSKLKAANDEIEEKRRLLADLNTRYDAVAAELAGAEANLSSADDLVTSAKAHLALKESLLFEKETLIAALKKRMRTGAKSSAAAPRFWQSFNRFRRSPGPAADQEVPASNA